MIKSVEKRDGRIVDFNPCKIKLAIQKAMDTCDIKDSYKEALIITDNVMQVLEKIGQDHFTIEYIQDVVEEELMKTFPNVAKSYILYRDERSRVRENKSELMQIVEEKLFAKNVQNQNANMDEKSFGGRLGEVKSEVVKRYALQKSMSKMSRDNHLNNFIYIHDLDSYAVGMHNCMTVPFDKLLANGFDTRNCDVRPANSINTAFQLVAVLFQLQSLQQFGGVSSSHLDWTMVPYVRKSFKKHLIDGMKYIEKKSDYKIERFKKWLKHDSNHPDGLIHFDDEEFKRYHEEAWQYALDMTEREVEQAAEGMYHNLNTLQSRSGNQLN